MTLHELMKLHPDLLLDEEDYIKYRFFTASLQRGYVYVTYINRKVYLLHRLIVGKDNEQEIDHIDRNRLNNRKSNLRFVTKAEQMVNKDVSILNTSGYKGISWHKASGKWRASLTKRMNGKDTHIHIGLFESKETAAAAYNLAAKKFHGPTAVLN